MEDNVRNLPGAELNQFADVKALAVFNAGADDLPGGCLLHVTGQDDDGVLLVTAPTADDEVGLLVNFPHVIPAGQYGQAHQDFPASVLYEAGEGTPAVGDEWGAKAGDPKLHPNHTGYTVQAVGTTEYVVVQPTSVLGQDNQLLTVVTNVCPVKDANGKVIDITVQYATVRVSPGTVLDVTCVVDPSICCGEGSGSGSGSGSGCCTGENLCASFGHAGGVTGCEDGVAVPLVYQGLITGITSNPFYQWTGSWTPAPGCVGSGGAPAGTLVFSISVSCFPDDPGTYRLFLLAGILDSSGSITHQEGLDLGPNDGQALGCGAFPRVWLIAGDWAPLSNWFNFAGGVSITVSSDLTACGGGSGSGSGSGDGCAISSVNEGMATVSGALTLTLPLAGSDMAANSLLIVNVGTWNGTGDSMTVTVTFTPLGGSPVPMTSASILETDVSSYVQQAGVYYLAFVAPVAVSATVTVTVTGTAAADICASAVQVNGLPASTLTNIGADDGAGTLANTTSTVGTPCQYIQGCCISLFGGAGGAWQGAFATQGQDIGSGNIFLSGGCAIAAGAGLYGVSKALDAARYWTMVAAVFT